ncbi:MAG: hypothetical protein IJS92_01370 [Paludibacteraceae bacterium]|nr:hypothetical protein [Paludibacteraceae bacterium]
MRKANKWKKSDVKDCRKALYMRIKRLYLRYNDHPQLIDNPDELRKAILLAYKQKRRV